MTEYVDDTQYDEYGQPIDELAVPDGKVFRRWTTEEWAVFESWQGVWWGSHARITRKLLEMPAADRTLFEQAWLQGHVNEYNAARRKPKTIVLTAKCGREVNERNREAHEQHCPRCLAR